MFRKPLPPFLAYDFGIASLTLRVSVFWLKRVLADASG